MKANLLRMVLAAKTTMFVGLAMLIAVAGLGILSAFSAAQAPSVSPTASAAPAPAKVFGTQVINANGTGGFPIHGTYTSKGGTLIIYAAGSAESGAANKKIGMKVSVNGAMKGTSQVYATNMNEHLAFVPAFLVVKSVPSGQVDIDLEELSPDTTIGLNDYFRVSVLEIPK